LLECLPVSRPRGPRSTFSSVQAVLGIQSDRATAKWGVCVVLRTSCCARQRGKWHAFPCLPPTVGLFQLTTPGKAQSCARPGAPACRRAGRAAQGCDHGRPAAGAPAAAAALSGLRSAGRGAAAAAAGTGHCGCLVALDLLWDPQDTTSWGATLRSDPLMISLDNNRSAALPASVLQSVVLGHEIPELLREVRIEGVPLRDGRL